MRMLDNVHTVLNLEIFNDEYDCKYFPRSKGKLKTCLHQVCISVFRIYLMKITYTIMYMTRIFLNVSLTTLAILVKRVQL